MKEKKRERKNDIIYTENIEKREGSILLGEWVSSKA